MIPNIRPLCLSGKFVPFDGAEIVGDFALDTMEECLTHCAIHENNRRIADAALKRLQEIVEGQATDYWRADR